MIGNNGHDDKDGDRIAKVIARAGLTSRREAEAWIAAGRVAVNGTAISSPALNVTGRDLVSVDGKPLPARERTRLFLYHKPRGLLTSHGDPQGRPTIFEHLPKQLPRLISVGRLDFNTEGLLLLSNDGALARVLELPTTGWLRRYRVRAHGLVPQARLDELRVGVTIDGIHYRAIEATLDRVQGSNVWLTLAIREGKNREVRNVLGHLGLAVARLIRVSFGPFQLSELAEGAIEEVPTRVLREQLGERVTALAGADFSAPVTVRNPEPAAKSPAQEERSKRPDRPKHSWRKREEDRPAKKLRRRFRGSRRDDDKQREPSAEEPRVGRAGLLTDRKGRRILVERHGEAPQQKPATQRTPEQKPFARAAPKRNRHRPRHRPAGGPNRRPQRP